MFAYLLLVMTPLQSIAAANMLVCNSMMQGHNAKTHHSSAMSASNQQLNIMPCHEHLVSSDTTDSKHKNTCKSSCGTLCSTLCAMTALPNDIKTTFTSTSSPMVGLAEQSYVSVTLPNTQRPPIFLS